MPSLSAIVSSSVHDSGGKTQAASHCPGEADAAQPITRQIADAAPGVMSRVHANLHPARGVVLDERPTGRHLLDVARQVVGRVPTPARDVLLDAGATAIIQVPGLARGIRRRVLPVDEPPLGVIRQLRTSRAGSRAGDGARWSTAGHIARRVVAHYLPATTANRPHQVNDRVSPTRKDDLCSLPKQ